MKDIDDEGFKNEALSGNAVVDFWAPWCGPCKIMAPHFEEASKEHEKVKFLKVNVDEQGELAQKYSVRSIPTVVYFKNGEEVGRTVGAMTSDKISEKIDEVFSE